MYFVFLLNRILCGYKCKNTFIVTFCIRLLSITNDYVLTPFVTLSLTIFVEILRSTVFFFVEHALLSKAVIIYFSLTMNIQDQKSM